MNTMLADYWRGKRVIVTGGNGFIGQHVVNMGLSLGAEVYNIARSEGNPKAHHISCDFANPPDFQPIMREIQPHSVFHLAANGVRSGDASLDQMLQVNVLGFKNLLEGLRLLETPAQVIAAGTWSEYADTGQPYTERSPRFGDTEYAVSKIMANSLLQHYSQFMPTTHLRIFNAYGVGERLPRLMPYLIQCAIDGTQADLTPGEQRRDFVYVTDIAEAFYRIGMTPTPSHRVLNLGSGQGHSLKQAVLTLKDLLAKRDLRLNVNFGGRPYRLNDVMVSVADTSQLHATLAWVPQTTLKDGLSAMVDAALS